MQKEVNKYKILNLIRYLGDGMFYPFFALYLSGVGLLEGRIGLLLSISPLLSILLNPIYTKICKNPKVTKDVLMITTVLEAIVIMALPYFSNFYILLFLTILLGIFGSCHYGMLDSLTTIFSDEAKLNYSSIRVFGSIAYIIATSLGGVIISKSYRITFIIGGILFLLTGFIYHLIMPITNTKLEVKKDYNLKSLLTNKSFITIIIIHMFLQGISRTCDNFFATYLETRNINSTIYGFVYSYFVLAEVIMLYIFNKKLKVTNNPYKMFTIASLLLAIRLLCNALNLNVYVIILLSALRGITYAIVLHFIYQYITMVVKKEEGVISVMINTLLYSIFLFIFSNFSGILIEKISYSIFYLINFILAIILMICCYIIYLNKKKNLNLQIEESNEKQ